MNHALTRSVLPAAVLFLLSALVLPGASHAIAAKGAYFTDSVLSADDLQQGSVGHNGDNQEFSVTSVEEAAPAPAPVAAFSSIPSTAPDFPHTVSPARAPPSS